MITNLLALGIHKMKYWQQAKWWYQRSGKANFFWVKNAKAKRKVNNNLFDMIYKRQKLNMHNYQGSVPSATVERVEFSNYPKCLKSLAYKSLLDAGAGGANPGMSRISLLFGWIICGQNKISDSSLKNSIVRVLVYQ